uniref:Histidine biosynthesis bifunctional protein HisIE n=1 Tax=uncultured Helicobacter sp. TaxID=175537 RepID=A0A650EJY1_9HELI|nr:histidine biosynthesis bifunctional protein HisIE [uncultured Helicobacter sp.]
MQSVLDQIDWEKCSLIPTIAQDAKTQDVLMLAYSSRQSLQETLQSNIAHYFSRSKNRIWKKGEQSGHIQKIISIKLDCDNDSLLFLVKQEGVACHTGAYSCFYRSLSSHHITQDEKIPTKDMSNTYDVLDQLYHSLCEKHYASPEVSYTASLFAKGDNTIAKKIIEEAGEFCFALKDHDEKEIIYECADLLYHTLVALAFKHISIERVYQELKSRMGQSGLAEKASRTKK